MSTTRSLRRCSSISTESTTNSLSIQELRNRIFLSDLHRIKNEDWWLDAFLQSYDYDVDITFAVIAECIRWRNNFNVENISILALKPLLDRQLMYIHGHDVEGNSILFINFIHYKNGDSGFENLFVFWIERHYMETKGAQLTVVKSWLDSGHPQIYQTKRESISQFVDVKFLQLHQGGNV
uniref:CRAL-TRIO domain-containing protein n=1 Tax=Heterorhabditis bacteriophora TaxID=37862 RepID=A0A1I7XQU6_HETBA